MSVARLLDRRQRALLAEAGIPLLPRNASLDDLRISVQTTTRGGGQRLVAVDVRAGVDTDAAVEVRSIARGLPLADIPREERGDRADRAHVASYLEREARSGLAMRTLELGDGEAERLTTPLDRLVATRCDELPAASLSVDVEVDGFAVVASSLRWGAHEAVWLDLPQAGVAVVAYVKGRPIPAFVTVR